jgi:hypothetical protein
VFFFGVTPWGIELKWGLNTWNVERNKHKLMEEQPLGARTRCENFFFQKMLQEGMVPDKFSSLCQYSMHVLVYKHLKRADVSICRSWKEVLSQFFMWPIASLICMPSVGTLRMLGRYLTRC